MVACNSLGLFQVNCADCFNQHPPGRSSNLVVLIIHHQPLCDDLSKSCINIVRVVLLDLINLARTEVKMNT